MIAGAPVYSEPCTYMRRSGRMKIYLEARVRGIKSGVEAKAPAIKLAGHGEDIESAVEALRVGVAAWCKGLLVRGRLERILTRENVRWEEGSDGVEIHLKISEPIGAYEP